MKFLLMLATLGVSLLAVVRGSPISPRNGMPPMNPAVFVPQIDLSRLPGYISYRVNVSTVDIPEFKIQNISKARAGFQEGLGVFKGKVLPVRLILPPSLLESPFKTIHNATLKHALIVDGEFISGSLLSQGVDGSGGFYIPVLSARHHRTLIHGNAKEIMKRDVASSRTYDKLLAANAAAPAVEETPTDPPANSTAPAFNSTTPAVGDPEGPPVVQLQGALLGGEFVNGPLNTFKLSQLYVTEGAFQKGIIVHMNGSFALLSGYQFMPPKENENPSFRYRNVAEIKKVSPKTVRLIDHDLDKLNFDFERGRITRGPYLGGSIASALFHHGYLMFAIIHEPHNNTVHQFWNRAIPTKIRQSAYQRPILSFQVRPLTNSFDRSTWRESLSLFLFSFVTAKSAD